VVEEQIDIFDDKYRLVGTAGKKEAHQKGLWHRVFTCILVNPKKQTILLQKKIPGKYSFDRPDYVDISVGGHYQAGESVPEGIRELEEEVGLDVKFGDLISLGVRQTAETVKEDYIVNEFQHLFICPTEQPLEEFNLEAVEVSGLVEVSIEDGIKLLLGKKDSIKARGLSVVGDERTIYEAELTREDFVPSYLAKDKFFLRLFIAAKRYIRGDVPDEIFC